jgi:hypothetical protein
LELTYGGYVQYMALATINRGLWNGVTISVTSNHKYCDLFGFGIYCFQDVFRWFKYEVNKNCHRTVQITICREFFNFYNTVTSRADGDIFMWKCHTDAITFKSGSIDETYPLALYTLFSLLKVDGHDRLNWQCPNTFVHYL